MLKLYTYKRMSYFYQHCIKYLMATIILAVSAPWSIIICLTRSLILSRARIYDTWLSFKPIWPHWEAHEVPYWYWYDSYWLQYGDSFSCGTLGASRLPVDKDLSTNVNNLHLLLPSLLGEKKKIFRIIFKLNVKIKTFTSNKLWIFFSTKFVLL